MELSENQMEQIIREEIEDILGGSFLSKGYQFAANQYRKRFCNGKARPLYDGEIHPLCANFEGQYGPLS